MLMTLTALYLGFWPFSSVTRFLAIHVRRFDIQGGVSVLVQRCVGRLLDFSS